MTRRASLTDKVRASWNRLSTVYRPDRARGDRTGHRNREYRDWLRPLTKSLLPGASVLDLGCGNGDPTDRILSRRYRVTGVDLSDVQIQRARRLVPNAYFFRADMTAVRFPPSSFDAVVSLYSMIHVPVRKHRPFIRRVYRWLRPGGHLLAIVGATPWTGKEQSWLGVEVEMYWSHAGASTYRKWLKEAGFRILTERFVPEGASGHELFHVVKPIARAARSATRRNAMKPRR